MGIFERHRRCPLLLIAETSNNSKTFYIDNAMDGYISRVIIRLDANIV